MKYKKIEPTEELKLILRAVKNAYFVDTLGGIHEVSSVEHYVPIDDMYETIHITTEEGTTHVLPWWDWNDSLFWDRAEAEAKAKEYDSLLDQMAEEMAD